MAHPRMSCSWNNGHYAAICGREPRNTTPTVPDVLAGNADDFYQDPDWAFGNTDWQRGYECGLVEKHWNDFGYHRPEAERVAARAALQAKLSALPWERHL